MTREFIDRYGVVASSYNTSRPHYPKELFNWLAAHAPSRSVAWDCACGSGQATYDLAATFNHVFATDASAALIAKTMPHPRIAFYQASAECSGLPDRSVDVINVGMAAHWFDLDQFYGEVHRVARPNALLALLVYGDPVISNVKANAHLQKVTNLVDPYGPPPIRHVRSAYAHLPFPFKDELCLPPMRMTATMTAGLLCDYLRGRSSNRDFVSEKGFDPVDELKENLSRWGDALFEVHWPLRGRAAIVPSPAVAFARSGGLASVPA